MWAFAAAAEQHRIIHVGRRHPAPRPSPPAAALRDRRYFRSRNVVRVRSSPPENGRWRGSASMPRQHPHRPLRATDDSRRAAVQPAAVRLPLGVAGEIVFCVDRREIKHFFHRPGFTRPDSAPVFLPDRPIQTRQPPRHGGHLRFRHHATPGGCCEPLRRPASLLRSGSLLREIPRIEGRRVRLPSRPAPLRRRSQPAR